MSAKTAEPGTLIEGTTLLTDTIPAMLRALADLHPEAYQQAQCPAAGHPMVPEYALEDDDSEWWDGDDALAAWDALHDALDECSPPGHHFGTHPGDGADLGWWPDD